MRNIIIAGGGLVNKGAQAMTLLCICELKKRFPDHRMLLLAWDASPAAREKHAMYDLELLEVPPLKFSGAAKNPVLRVLYSLFYGDTFRRCNEIYRNTDLFVDISGYAIGTTWSAEAQNYYLDNLEYAQAYDIPVYLLPQSFGPFDYMDEAGKAIDVRIRRLFVKADRIFAREQEGYNVLVSRYSLTNVSLTHDMVLTSRIHDYSPALREKFEWSLPEIPENSIALIPNIRVNDNGINDIEKLYCTAIDASLAQNFRVYITYHSTQDKVLCYALKTAFANNDRVVLLDRDLSCIEFNELVPKFNFVIASRFHALVHALKNGVPCIALGWAVKYIELMKLFRQERYVFDLSLKVDLTAVSHAVSEMAQSWEKEADTIRAALPNLQKENVFDSIKRL